MNETIRLLLADDQEMVRAGFRMVLDAQQEMTVVGEVGDGRDAVDAVLGAEADQRPDLVLMDIRMPRLNGVVATEAITAATSTKVLVLTTFDLDEYVYSALQAGASGFLLKDAGPAELLAAIRAVASGEAVVAPSATRRLLEHVAPSLPDHVGEEDDRLSVLTERELEVLGEVARGATNAEIAEHLFMAEGTVKNHVSALLRKLDARDRVGLVLIAYETGLVHP